MGSEKLTAVYEQYELQITKSIRTRGAILCETEEGIKLLKEFRGSLGRLELEDKVLNYLSEEGIRTDTYVKNKNGQVLTLDSDGTGYVLKDWFDGRECDVKNGQEVLAAVRSLARLHKGFLRISPKVAECWLQEEEPDLREELFHHQTELKRVRSFIRNRRKKSEFEYAILKHFEHFYSQGEYALCLLQKSDYEKRKKEAKEKGILCHGNYNQHNIMVSMRKISIVNFEHMNHNFQIMDFYLFLRKMMEKCNWERHLGFSMMEEYERERKLEEEERVILFAMLSYPEKFWKIVNHYYNGNKAWISQKDVDKLMNVIRQEEEKQQFLSEMQTKQKD